MNHTPTSGLLLALAMACSAGTALAQNASPAQAAPLTRAQVRMDTAEFLKTHEWIDATDTWVLKSGYEPPTGVVSRATVKAQRDEFLRNNRWDDRNAVWSPRKPVPPTVSGLTRAQVRADTAAFTRTHHWDEEKSEWLANPPLKRQ
jgi:hypothetical protein